MTWIIISSLFMVIILAITLVSKKDNKIVLWPEYFDKSISKSRGRRVPLKLATNTPTTDEIAKAAKRLKLNPKIEAKKSYPGRWSRQAGRVLVSSKIKKTKIIRRVAMVVKKYKKK